MERQKQTSTESAAIGAPDAEGATCTVYFDGSCPLCQAEISLYRGSGAEARFVDITQDDAPPEIGREAALKRFHLRRADGRLVSGAAAFAELWKATPGWRWLGFIAAVPPFVWIGEGLYRAFLVVRPAIQGVVRRAAR